MEFEEAFKEWFVREHGRFPSKHEVACARFGVEYARHRLVDHFVHQDRAGRAA